MVVQGAVLELTGRVLGNHVVLQAGASTRSVTELVDLLGEGCLAQRQEGRRHQPVRTSSDQIDQGGDRSPPCRLPSRPSQSDRNPRGQRPKDLDDAR